MNFTKLLTSCKEKQQRVSNQAFTTTEKGMSNVCERCRKWSQMNPRKISEHKDANKNQRKEKATPQIRQIKTNEKKKWYHVKS